MRKRADWKQAVLEAGRARVEKRWQLKIVAAAGKSELCTEAGLGQCRCQNAKRMPELRKAAKEGYP